jgi:hypothetical protein
MDWSIQTAVAQRLHLIKVMDMHAVGVLCVGRDSVGANSFSNKLALLSHLLCYRVQIGFILKSKTREVMSITFDLCSLKLSSQRLQIIIIIKCGFLHHHKISLKISTWPLFFRTPYVHGLVSPDCCGPAASPDQSYGYARCWSPGCRQRFSWRKLVF